MPPKPITRNTLFYGDNLPILREYIADASVDLVYLDPPFNSNRSYNATDFGSRRPSDGLALSAKITTTRQPATSEVSARGESHATTRDPADQRRILPRL